MENKTSYTIVGIFVVFFITSIILFVFWLVKYNIDTKNVKHYKIFVTESISGLKKNSLVSYKGIEIGQVHDIKINKNNIEQIEISLYVKNDKVIKKDSLAIVQNQGITGNKYIEITGGTSSADILSMNNEGFAIIPLEKSLLGKISQNAQSVASKVDSIITKLDSLLNVDTLNNFSEIVQNINKSTKHLYQEQMNVDILLGKINKFLSNENLQNINSSLTNTNEISYELKELLKNDIKSLIIDVKNTLKAANKNSSNINDTIDKFEDVLINVNEKIDNFSSNKNSLFLLRDIKYGPGEIK